MTHQNIIEYLKTTSEKINQIVNDQIDLKIDEAKTINSLPYQMVNHFKLLSSKGKNIRGTLVNLGYQVGQESEDQKILKAASAIEIFQTGILVHDDIMDKSPSRRGLLTTHELFKNTFDEQYGNNMAISLGDFSFYFSIETLLDSGFDTKLVLQATKLYSQFSQRLVHGQVLDISTETLNNVNQDYILKIYKYKTAEYTGIMPLLIGYILSGKNDNKVYESLVKYGTCFGWAFQIQDDVLDIFGKSNQTGKPLGGDILEGKNTLLNYYLEQYASQDDIYFVKSFKGKKRISDQDLIKLQDIYKNCGSLQKVKQIAHEYVEMGKNEIQNITTNSKTSILLTELIDYMIYRMS